jgi:hypothetical protein
MLIWCAVLFGLGILAFMDSIFNYGEIFRQVNSVLFLLTSLGLLVRTTTKIRGKQLESYQEQVARLEMEMRSLRAEQDSLKHAPMARQTV